MPQMMDHDPNMWGQKATQQPRPYIQPPEGTYGQRGRKKRRFSTFTKLLIAFVMIVAIGMFLITHQLTDAGKQVVSSLPDKVAVANKPPAHKQQPTVVVTVVTQKQQSNQTAPVNMHCGETEDIIDGQYSFTVDIECPLGSLVSIVTSDQKDNEVGQGYPTANGQITGEDFTFNTSDGHTVIVYIIDTHGDQSSFKVYAKNG